MQRWLQKNTAKYFGPNVKLPSEFFIAKIAEDLNLYDITLRDLDKIFQDVSLTERYNTILETSSLSFLPPYQSIVFRILLSLNLNERRVIELVNRELAPLGSELRRSPRW